MVKLSALATVLLVPLLAACAPASPPDGRPLLDDRHVPDVLVEEARVALPPAVGGNRFVAGWHPWRARRRPVLTVRGPSSARLEIVRLAPRPRTLVLDLWDGEPPAGRVGVRAAGRALGRVGATDPLTVVLPADLPLGRVPVELTPAPEAKLHVLAAALRDPLPAGAAEREAEDLVHRGASFVDLYRRVAPDAELAGTFVPPDDPGAGQAFRMWVEDGTGDPRLAFEWTPSWWRRLRGPVALRVPLGGGYVRIRLEARGEGAPARWQGFRIVEPAEPAPETALKVGPRAWTRPGLVVLYVMDALRADAVGPTFERLAREGFRLRRHRSVAPNTLPSTIALFSGRTPIHRPESGRPPPERATLAETFRDAGYRTALVSSNPYTTDAYGLTRGFDVAIDVPIPDPPAGVAWNDSAARVHDAALGWLREVPREEPVFLYVHTLNPHNPYEPPEPYRSRALPASESTIDGRTETLIAIQRGRREVDDADRDRLRRLYAAGARYNDAELETFLAELERLRSRDELFLAVTSDHGEELFEHGGVLHGYTLYDEMVAIPLLLFSPGRVPPGALEIATDTLDLHATLTALAGADPDSTSEGRSLLPLLLGQAPSLPDRPHFASASSLDGGLFSARTDRWKLLYAPRTGLGWGTGQGRGRRRDAEFLFDLVRDPGEHDNRVGHGDLEAGWLRSRLLAWIARRPDAARVETPAVDEKTRERLRALGYVE